MGKDAHATAVLYHAGMRRVLVGELMDDPSASREELDRALHYIRWVNRRLGGASALLHHLHVWSRRWPRKEQGTVTLLDIGTGSADIPVAALAWARRRGVDLRITAVDLHQTTLDLAHDYIARHNAADAITLVQADALELMDCFLPGGFDYVHAGMFLHHLPQVEALTALRIMDRLARAGIIWNDLVRSRRSLAVVNLLLIGQPPMVKHDARASIRAGFTKAEALDMARRVGLTYARYRAVPLMERFTLAGERAGAWGTG